MAADSKTEKATPKKRRDERKEGNIFQSTDVVNVVFIFVAFYFLGFFFSNSYEAIANNFKQSIQQIATINEVTAEIVGSLAIEGAIVIAKCVLPLGLICASTSIVLHGVQTRFLFVGKLLKPQFNRLSPLEGIKKIFSMRNVVELLKNIAKLVILISILYSMLHSMLIGVIRTTDMDIITSIKYMFELSMDIIFRITLVFAVVAGADYLFQRYDYEKRIRMSKQDIKEEFKQMEGNPEIKGKIRENQRRMAQQRMMQAVPNADVIIRNPTHFAVALGYDSEKHQAPVVLAKGQDELALRIVAVGEEHDVTVIENKPLARGLYSSTEINQEIPTEYYSAIAEILVYAFKLKHKMR